MSYLENYIPRIVRIIESERRDTADEVMLATYDVLSKSNNPDKKHDFLEKLISAFDDYMIKHRDICKKEIKTDCRFENAYIEIESRLEEVLNDIIADGQPVFHRPIQQHFYNAESIVQNSGAITGGINTSVERFRNLKANFASVPETTQIIQEKSFVQKMKYWVTENPLVAGIIGAVIGGVMLLFLTRFLS